MFGGHLGFGSWCIEQVPCAEDTHQISLGPGNPHPMAPVRLPYLDHKPQQGNVPSGSVWAFTASVWLHLLVFSRFQASPHITLSNHKACHIFTSAYIIFPNHLLHSFQTSHKDLCLGAKKLPRNEEPGWGYRVRASRSGFREVAFPKTPAAHPNSPASPQHAYKSPQLCQRTRNASWKPFLCNRSWV